MTDDEEKTGTDNASPREGTPVEVIKEDSPLSSDVPARTKRGGEIQVTAPAGDTITIYYDAVDVERRRTIFRLNRGSPSGDDTSGD